jgi:poly(3-hydroxybutyrate) depolymerase
MRARTAVCALIGLTLGEASAAAAELAFQERECIARGWKHVEMTVAGLERRLLWKAKDGPWTRGALLVLHGGGGRHFGFCFTRLPLIEPQVRFAELAVADGFATFLLDSTDRFTDADGRPCGKAWDDQVQQRPNLDLPFIAEVIGKLVPALRPAGSRSEVFMTGLSSGGYMTVRAATRFDDRIRAFAPVSSGDPYGWHRTCDPRLSARRIVRGVGLDNETEKPISERGACRADAYPNEKPWESARPARKPPFRLFHHENDAIHDFSCGEKVRRQLLAHGYPEAPPYIVRGGMRRLVHHFWLDEYSRPLLDFFASQLRD